VASNLPETLRRASANVQQSCEMLRCPTPEVLDRCSALLQTAVRDLIGSHPEPDGKASALGEARQLLKAVRHARVLLDKASAFREAWSRRLAAMTAGYTARGEPASVNHSFRLAVRG